jgi:hypothetical protein
MKQVKKHSTLIAFIKSNQFQNSFSLKLITSNIVGIVDYKKQNRLLFRVEYVINY